MNHNSHLCAEIDSVAENELVVIHFKGFCEFLEDWYTIHFIYVLVYVIMIQYYFFFHWFYFFSFIMHIIFTIV